MTGTVFYFPQPYNLQYGIELRGSTSQTSLIESYRAFKLGDKNHPGYNGFVLLIQDLLSLMSEYDQLQALVADQFSACNLRVFDIHRPETATRRQLSRTLTGMPAVPQDVYLTKTHAAVVVVDTATGFISPHDHPAQLAAIQEDVASASDYRGHLVKKDVPRLLHSLRLIARGELEAQPEIPRSSVFW